jgi:hypothetical protein
VGDPVGEHARLARPRSGEHEKRPLAVQNSLTLRLVEALEKAFGSGRRGHRSRIERLPAVTIMP